MRLIMHGNQRRQTWQWGTITRFTMFREPQKGCEETVERSNYFTGEDNSSVHLPGLRAIVSALQIVNDKHE